MNNNNDLLNEDGSIKLPNSFGISPSLLPQEQNALLGLGEGALKHLDTFQNHSGVEMSYPITGDLAQPNFLEHINHGTLIEQASPLNTFETKPLLADYDLMRGVTDTFQTSVILPRSSLLDSNDGEDEAREKEEKERLAKQQEQMAKDLEDIKKNSSERKEIYIYDPQKLIQDHPLSESPYIRSFMNKIGQADRKLNWKCNFCGRFMKDAPILDCYSAVERLYKQFSEGGYVPCKECKADNFFIVTTDTVIFNCIQSLTINPVKHAVEKERRNRDE